MKSGKLNEVGKIFPGLFYLNKYTLVTTISCMLDDVETSRSFKTNRSKMIGVLYCLTLKIISQHLIDSFMQVKIYFLFQLDRWIYILVMSWGMQNRVDKFSNQ